MRKGFRLLDSGQTSQLVKEAAAGDAAAWNLLVEHFSGLVWSVAGAYRLERADVSDVVQVTWLRLVEHIGRLKDPERLGAWLATTARRECLRVLHAANREVPTEEERFQTAAGTDPSPEAAVLSSERSQLLWGAFQQISAECQELLRALLFAWPALSYAEIGDALGMPVGSIGPTRARCLAHLRRKLGSDVSEPV
jgi:RNA polymerase sigma factor (sigma-70 family)